MVSYKRTINAADAPGNYRAILEERGAPEDITLAHSNGTTEFLILLAGVILAKIISGDDEGKWRPCGKQMVNGTQVGVTVLLLDSTDGLYVGDAITIWDESAGSALTTKTITAIDPGVSITFSGAVNVSAGDWVYVTNAPTAGRILNIGGVDFYTGRDADGEPVYEDQDFTGVRDAIIDEDLADARFTLSAQIMLDLLNPANGCEFIFQ